MANIETALKAIAAGNAGLVALIGTRFFHGVAAQNAASPYVCYTRISDIPDRVMGGRSGLRRAHYQVEAWAEPSSTQGAAERANAVAAAVFAAFDEYKGTSDTIVIDWIHLEYGPEDDGGVEGTHRVILELWADYRS